MKRETLYQLMCQYLYAGVYSNAKDGKQFARFAASLFNEYADSAMSTSMSSALRSKDGRFLTARKAADFLPNIATNLMLCIGVGGSEGFFDSLGLNNKEIISQSLHKRHIENATLHKNAYGEPIVMTELNKTTIGDTVITLATRLRDASDEYKREIGLKSDSNPADYLSKAIEVFCRAAPSELHATAKAFEGMGEFIFDSPTTYNVTEIVDAMMTTATEVSVAKPAGEFEPIALNPNFEAVIHTMLSSATGNRINNFAEINDAFTKAASLEKELHKLQSRLKTAASHVSVAPTEVGEDGTKLNVTASSVSASDIFTRKGKKTKVLNFDIPRFTWSGNHKDVPDVDEGYEFRLSYLLGILPALKDGKNVWLFGHTGTGKSTLVQQIAARLGWPVTRINLDSGIERSDLIGKTELVIRDGKQVTEYVEGLVVHAMRNGHILLLDEVDFGRSDVMYVLQRILEGGGIQLLEGEKRELVKPHPAFRIIATANTRGQGDEMGLYQGAMVQSEAYRDRFTVWVEVDYLDAEQETDVLLANVPELDKAVADKMIQLAGEIRKAFTGGEILQTISPRALIEMGRGYCFYSEMLNPSDAIMMSIELTVLNKAATDSQAVIKEIAKRVFA